MDLKVQAYTSGLLAEHIERYVAEKGCSRAQAGKELMELGCHVWLRSKDKPENKLTIVEMIEKLMKVAYRSLALQQVSIDKNVRKANDSNGQLYNHKDIVSSANLIADKALEETIGKKI